MKKVKDLTWFQCSAPKGFWKAGEYLIQKAPRCGVVIWVDNMAGVTHIKSGKKAYEILQSEFHSIVKIDR